MARARLTRPVPISPDGREIAKAIADGYDPAQGILHSRAAPDRQSFVFDMMEPLRPVVDRAVLKLIKEETFSGADFILQQDGVCRLGPELARRVVHEVSQQLRSAA